jgi:isocitrate dehydrogenase
MTKFLRWQNTPDLALLRRKRDKCNEKQFEEENQMAKIQMTTPLVEMDGDEMTRVLWQWIKDILLTPYVDLKTEYYDLGLEYREKTKDQVTIDSANATKKYGVAVKCATITPNAARMPEYNLSQMWKSPNGTIRAILDGTVFRTPILVKGIEPYIPTWTAPITIARHAYGDVYKNTEMKVKQGSKAELVVTDAEGKETRELIFNFEDTDGIIQGLHNKNNSIAGFARACFNYGLDLHQDVWFATKDTISKKYDHTFKDIFQEIYDNEYKEKFEAAGIEYFYTLIDDAVARVMKAKGGFIWACKNYDGDVMSDMVSSAFGSLAMMTSVLVSPAGVYEYEAAHGTVQRHYYKHLKGEETSTNSVATIFAWTGALRKRGELDKLPELCAFADKLEKATLDTIESGRMTKDLALITELTDVTVLNSQDFIKAIRKTMEK